MPREPEPAGLSAESASPGGWKKISKRARFWAVVAMLTLAASCTPSEELGDPEQSPVEIEAVSSTAATNLPPASVLIGHRVVPTNNLVRRLGS